MTSESARRMAAALAAAMLLAVCDPSPAVRAQTAAASGTLAFEVASIKVNRTGSNQVTIGSPPGGRFTASNVTIRELLRLAFSVQPFQLVGEPEWAGSDRFDITAKAAEADRGNGVTFGGPFDGPGPMREMLRSLLADRFALRTHAETREMPIYHLTTARSDGRLGPALTRSSQDCGSSAAPGRGAAGPPPGPPGGLRPGDTPRCGTMIGFGDIRAGGVTMAQFAASLAPRVNRVVQDHSGLSGTYDLRLQFTPEQLPLGPPPPGVAPPVVDPNGPSLFTALQEQLGLRLEAARGPVDVIVIDRIARPTED